MSKSKLIGAATMVAGTSIGAAMIAMPVSAAKIGFFNTCILLLIISFVMYYVAQIALQIYRITDSNNTMSKIASEVLGKPFAVICSAATLILLYSLLVAYISGLSEIAYNTIENDYIINVISLSLVLFLSLGFSNKLIDYYNRVVFFLKIICMIGMIGILLPNISTTQLMSSNAVMTDNIGIMQILTVFVTAFGFHAGIPFIYKFLNNDYKLYKQSVFYGVVATFVIYIIWIVMVFGIVLQNNLFMANDSISDLITLLSHNVQNSKLGQSIMYFVVLAILTSLLGVAISVFDFIEEFLKYKFNFSNRFIASGITFVPPTLFAISNKSLFIKALGLAGCCLTILAIIIPCLIRSKLYSDSEEYNPLLLWSCFCIGILTIVGELLTL